MAVVRKGFLEEVMLEMAFEKRRGIFLMNMIGRAFQTKAKAKRYTITWHNLAMPHLFHSFRMQF